MRFVWGRLRACSAFQGWTTPGLWLAHTYGHGNPGADMASRGYFAQLEAFCAQDGVRPTRLEAPAAAIALFDSFSAEHVSRHAASLANSQPFNLFGDGPGMVIPLVGSARPVTCGSASAKRSRLLVL